MKILKRVVHSFLLLELFQGLAVTLKSFFSRKTTIEYPEEETPISPRFRGMLALRRYPNGEERCIACKLCEAVCPALAITIQAEPRPDGSRRTSQYDIDVFKCINCGFCEEACPVDAIVVTPEMHYHVKGRGRNILSKDELLAIGERYEKVIEKDRIEDSKYR